MKRRRASLGELCDLVKGTSPISKTPPGPYPLVTTGESHKTASSFQFDADAVCIPLISSTGHGHASLKRVHHQSGKFALANLLAAALVKEPSVLSPRFLMRYLMFAKDRLIVPLMTGAANMSISIDRLATVPVEFPPLAQQKRIVRLLDEADELRKLRDQADRRTDALIPALFHEMFGRDEEWPVDQLENLCKRVTVGHVGPMSTEYVESGITFLRGQNIKRGWLDLSSVLFVSKEFHKRLEKSAIYPGDVVSVRTGKPGTTAVIPPFLKVANCADLIVMTCRPQLNPHFLGELLNQRLGDKDKIAGATGIAQQHFNIGEARRLKLALPPLALQEEFARRVTEIREMETEQAASRTRLEALFQSTFHRAFQGEL